MVTSAVRGRSSLQGRHLLGLEYCGGSSIASYVSQIRSELFLFRGRWLHLVLMVGHGICVRGIWFGLFGVSKVSK